MNEHDSKVVIALIWGIVTAVCVLIGSQSIYYSIRDAHAIKEGLSQSQQTTSAGGYWIKGDK